MNNRQAGRRRGRGGQRSQGGNPNSQGNGNRIDNRARGNAAQLLEKYKNLARDAQMQGDRVNTEYYLQFADHYFRVLNENRARFEEQNQNRRQRADAMDDDDDQDEAYEGVSNGVSNVPHAAQFDDSGDEGDDAPANAAEAEAEAEDRQPRRRGRRPRAEAPVEAAAQSDDEDTGIADRLPPALSVSDAGTDEGEEEAKPRRRGRRPRASEEALGQA